MKLQLVMSFLLLAACTTPVVQDVPAEPPGTAVQTLIASGFAHPWDMAFVGQADALVTEKDGTLKYVHLGTGEVRAVPGVPSDLDNIRRDDPRDNSGLFGIVPDPDFPVNRFVYMAYSAGDETGTVLKVIRARFDDGALKDVTTILEVPPLSTDRFHYGGGLAFGADGLLYITAGERIFNELDQPPFPVAQDVRDMRGKIYRIHPDGALPVDNPGFGEGAVPGLYAKGIRAAQGITRHPVTGTLWFSEHGSIQGDEINVLKPGANYGWPVVTRGTYRNAEYAPPAIEGTFEPPVWSWPETVAPTGLTFYTGGAFPEWEDDLFVAGLSRGSLWRLETEGETVTSAVRLFEETPVRLRNVRQGPDGALYLLTDEADGRILRIDRE